MFHIYVKQPQFSDDFNRNLIRNCYTEFSKTSLHQVKAAKIKQILKLVGINLYTTPENNLRLNHKTNI